jgi:hypothetical protein
MCSILVRPLLCVGLLVLVVALLLALLGQRSIRHRRRLMRRFRARFCHDVQGNQIGEEWDFLRQIP